MALAPSAIVEKKSFASDFMINAILGLVVACEAPPSSFMFVRLVSIFFVSQPITEKNIVNANKDVVTKTAFRLIMSFKSLLKMSNVANRA